MQRIGRIARVVHGAYVSVSKIEMTLKCAFPRTIYYGPAHTRTRTPTARAHTQHKHKHKRKHTTYAHKHAHTNHWFHIFTCPIACAPQRAIPPGHAINSQKTYSTGERGNTLSDPLQREIFLEKKKIYDIRNKLPLTHTNTHTRTHTQTHTNMHAHAPRAHAHAHTNTHTHKHKHTNTHKTNTPTLVFLTFIRLWLPPIHIQISHQINEHIGDVRDSIWA